jgi:hypothetical protein
VVTEQTETKFMSPELEVKYLEHRIKVLCEALTHAAIERDAALDALRYLDDLAVGGLTVGSNVNPTAIRAITQSVLKDDDV